MHISKLSPSAQTQKSKALIGRTVAYGDNLDQREKAKPHWESYHNVPSLLETVGKINTLSMYLSQMSGEDGSNFDPSTYIALDIT